MAIESLIPFGFHVKSGQLVDVGSSERGNACGCICPSCETPLVARKGDEKEWHFAHRSQKVHNEIRKQCEYSFALSVRLMIRQLSNDGLKLRTPRLELALPAFSDQSGESANFGCLVTEESLLTLSDVQVGTNFCGVTVDVLGFVEGIPFVVFVTYKERLLPSELKCPSTTKCGVIELNVKAVSTLFEQEEQGRYKEVLRRYIENEVDGKSWAYHPREQKLKQVAIAKRQLWLSQQKTKAKPRQRLKSEVESMRPTFPRETAELTARRVRNYTCVMCKSEWTGTSWICKRCGTHLYTTEKD